MHRPKIIDGLCGKEISLRILALTRYKSNTELTSIDFRRTFLINIVMTLKIMRKSRFRRHKSKRIKVSDLSSISNLQVNKRGNSKKAMLKIPKD